MNSDRYSRFRAAGLSTLLLATSCNVSGEVLTGPVTSRTDAGAPSSPAPGSGSTPTSGSVAPVPSTTVEPPALAAHGFTSGTSHSCVIRDGATYCWGQNDDGELGAGHQQEIMGPSRVLGGHSFHSIAAGRHHTCAIDDRDQVYCWGQNQRGQLGHGSRESSLEPVLVPLPERAVRISTRFNHTCAVLVNARLLCWGKNDEGELGQGQDGGDDGLSPLEIGDLVWREASTGDGHTCAIELDGSLWCWGRNTSNELGIVGEIQIREPTQVGADTDWLNVLAGQNYSCALKEDFSLWCWGENTAYEEDEGSPLGIEVPLTQTPTRVGTEENWRTLSGNTFHTCAINGTSELWCWGRNVEGQLGVGDTALRATPTLVGSGYAAVEAQRFSTCAVLQSRAVACTGENSAYQLGLIDADRRNEFSVLTFE